METHKGVRYEDLKSSQHAAHSECVFQFKSKVIFYWLEPIMLLQYTFFFFVM